ncbi:unnamed protein product [Dovyalis caffra]|uniref:TIR domain-containing protein n=1 Tax=Dovyalis caffra TaxID=77055 RepID=A0AAV1RAR4_9ROSI|nr:unnamed protein product [Dovyalis caffra]
MVSIGATFIDDKLSGGRKLEAGLLEKIEESNISVVIFSKNYADSTFCFSELLKILECKETKGQIVLPVFYQVDPTEVQEASESFGTALGKHEQECSSAEVRRWRHALKEIANLKGWDSNITKQDTKLICEIVSDIQKKLDPIFSLSDSKGFFGIKSRIKDVESLLYIGSPGVRIVGILEMGGIGKTTITEWIFNRISTLFEGRCFLPNVREQSSKRGLLPLRVEILSKGTKAVQAISLDISKIKEISLSPTVFEGMCNLRLLEFYDSFSCETKIILPEGLKFLPGKLRFLSWDDYPLKSLPSNFCMHNLVKLGMPYSNLEELWNEVLPLVNLKLMDVSFPKNSLIRMNPKLSKVPNLVVLNLSGCNVLGMLDFSKVPNLPILDLSWCSSLIVVPSFIECCTKLTKLDLSYNENLLESLPSSIGQLKCLAELDLSYCSKLASLPNSIYDLESLVTLDLVGCRNLNRPESKLIVEIVDAHLKKLNLISSSNLEGLVGINPRIQEVEALLCIGRLNVCTLGI